jgi:predicted TIM-barrel fold metal-dependent hydrolase
MPVVDFELFDADNHYYEAVDAFTRHLDPKMAKRGVQWATVDGKLRILVGGRIFRFIPNPTFDPVARPGSLDQYFRGRNPKGQDVREAFGALEAIESRPEYRDREARISVMDKQAMDGCFLFPTLGVGIEEALRTDIDALYASFHAFDQWLDEDWGFHYQERLYAAPLISLLDENRAVEELQFVLDRGARIICLRTGPLLTPSGGRSPADPIYDEFWGRVEDAGVLVGYHSGDAGYDRYANDWGASSEMLAFMADPFKRVIHDHRPIFDTVAALVCHGLFTRFPKLKVATIESGSSWVPNLVKSFKKTYGQIPQLFPEDPIEAFHRNIWVSPFFEDDLPGLAKEISIDHILMGSDWPHAEGLPEPRDFALDLRRYDFPEEDIRSIMQDNGRTLTVRSA